MQILFQEYNTEDDYTKVKIQKLLSFYVQTDKSYNTKL